jgi:hypothetical protein
MFKQTNTKQTETTFFLSQLTMPFCLIYASINHHWPFRSYSLFFVWRTNDEQTNEQMNEQTSKWTNEWTKFCKFCENKRSRCSSSKSKKAITRDKEEEATVIISFLLEQCSMFYWVKIRFLSFRWKKTDVAANSNVFWW